MANGNGSVYNLGYYEGMLRNYSATAHKICAIRWQFIARCNPKKVLDYGSGVGWFRALRPNGIEVDTYDIADYPQTGINSVQYDVVCFWDVLEHVTNFAEIEAILRNSKFVAVTVPIKPPKKDLDTWKHFKPGEHLHYFDVSTLTSAFSKYGYTLYKEDSPECPPREDIVSILFANMKYANKEGGIDNGQETKETEETEKWEAKLKNLL